MLESLVVFALGLVSLACRVNSDDDDNDVGKDGGLPNPMPTTDGPIEPDARSHRYQPPEKFFISQAAWEGIFYHPPFVLAEEEESLGLPRLLKCPNEKCYFIGGNKLFSFASDLETLANEMPIPLTTAADFALEADGVTTKISDFLIDGSFIYAAYGGGESGIAIRRLPNNDSEPGERVVGFPFFSRKELEDFCPSRMFLSGNTLWFSAFNCREEEALGSGLVMALNQQSNGNLWLSGRGPWETTWKYPEALASTDLGDGVSYLLAIASGQITLAGEILSESGIDVFDLDTNASNPLVGKIPLGDATAFGFGGGINSLVAFHASLNQPNLYVTDLLRMGIDILNAETTVGEPMVLNDVPISDASNPVRFLPPGFEVQVPEIPGLNSVFAFDYHSELQTVLASYLNGNLFQVHLPTTINSGGIELGNGFGEIAGHYYCSSGVAQYCGPVAFLPQGGAVVLTGEPVGVTYLPPERLTQ